MLRAPYVKKKLKHGGNGVTDLSDDKYVCVFRLVSTDGNIVPGYYKCDLGPAINECIVHRRDGNQYRVIDVILFPINSGIEGCLVVSKVDKILLIPHIVKEIYDKETRQYWEENPELFD